MKELDDILEHAGVKGMKWGVRKAQNAVKSLSDSKLGNSKAGKRVKEELKSAGRELHWTKKLKDVDKMSSKDINKLARRIQLENDLKRLTTTKVNKTNLVRKALGDKTLASAKDKQDYRRRGNMSDQELTRKVDRLRVKQNLSRTVTQASKQQVDRGKKAVDMYKTYKGRPTDPQKARDKILREYGFERMG